MFGALVGSGRRRLALPAFFAVALLPGAAWALTEGAAPGAPPVGEPAALLYVGQGAVESSSRQIVRTVDGRVYIAAADDGGEAGPTRMRMYRATTTGVPTAFEEVDAQDAATASGNIHEGPTLVGGDARLDRAGVIHVTY